MELKKVVYFMILFTLVSFSKMHLYSFGFYCSCVPASGYHKRSKWNKISLCDILLEIEIDTPEKKRHIKYFNYDRIVIDCRLPIGDWANECCLGACLSLYMLKIKVIFFKKDRKMRDEEKNIYFKLIYEIKTTQSKS